MEPHNLLHQRLIQLALLQPDTPVMNILCVLIQLKQQLNTVLFGLTQKWR